MIEFNELIQGTNYLKIKVEKGIKKIQHISIYAEDIHSNSIYVAINTNKYSSTDGSLGLSGDEDSVFGLAGTKNGVDAIDLAIKNGANCIVTDDENVFINYVGKITLILVKDSLIFLCELSKKIQEIKNFKVLAITGSVGKTTTTHIMYMSLKALDYKVVKSNRIRSTLLGLCIDILNVIDIDVDYFVFELQSDGVGQINKICQATKIDYAFITNIQNCHLSKFGNENNIFEEKTSIIKHLNKNGVIFVNSNDDNLCKFVKKYKDVLEIFDINFALEYIESTQFNNLYNNIKNNKHLNLTIANKFAIAFVITFLAHIKEKRFNTETIKTILKIQQPYLRYNKFIGRNNSEIIIDSYNGSFLSMEKGIVDTCKNEKKEIVLVLGSMLELGNDSELYHTKLGRIIANQMNVCNVLLLGEGMLYAYFELKKANTKIPVKHFFDYNDLISALLEIELSDKKTIYIKGSGSMRMELIAPYVLSSFNDKEV